MMQQDTAGTDAAALQLSSARRYYILVLLLAVGTMNFLDRNIMSVLLEPIRKDLQLSDTMLGSIIGLAFALTFVALCIPAAWLADRWSRRKVLAGSLAVWSIATMFCGAAANGAHLLLARVGVGFGEAGGSPPSQAIVSDLFRRERRATALAIWALCSPFGFMLGLIWGGWAVEQYGWRTTFLLAGAPGLLLVPLLLWTVPEVPKGMSDGIAKPLPDAPFFATVQTLLSIGAFRNLMFGAALQTLLAIGLNGWVPSFLARSHHVTPAGLFWYAIMAGAGLILGSLVGGPLFDWLGKRDLRHQFRLGAVAVLISAACSATAFLAPLAFVFPLLGVQSFFAGLFAGPLYAIAMTLAPIAARAVAGACLLVVINIVAVGIAPFMVGWISDLLRPAFGEESLRMALVSATVVAFPAATFYLLASRTFRSDVAAAEARAQTV